MGKHIEDAKSALEMQNLTLRGASTAATSKEYKVSSLDKTLGGQ